MRENTTLTACRKAKLKELEKAYAQQFLDYINLFASTEPRLWDEIKTENKDLVNQVIERLEKAAR